MATEIKNVKVKCLQCKKQLIAEAKVDSKTGKISKIVQIFGGDRRISSLGYNATYCNACIQKLFPEKITTTAKFFKGDRVKFITKPEWGVGQVLADGSIFFVNVGRKKVDFRIARLTRVYGKEAEQPLLEICNEVGGIGEGHHNVYVIELRKDVLNIHKFRDANPYHDSSKPCLYVGVTGISPEERFENHKAGYKSSYFPKKFGVRLLPDFFKWLNPLPYEEASRIESVFADKLRLQGYAVWQN